LWLFLCPEVAGQGFQASLVTLMIQRRDGE